MKDRFPSQIELFPEPEFVPEKTLMYGDLSINEKINVKANSQGFANMYLFQSAFFGIRVRRDDHPEKLTDNWFWFITHNSGGRKSCYCEEYHENIRLKRPKKTLF